MVSIGEWLKRLDSASAALGFILLVGTILVTAVSSVWTNVGIPSRVEALEATMSEHISKEEESTARIYCVTKEIFDYIADGQERPINPLACDEGGES